MRHQTALGAAAISAGLAVAMSAPASSASAPPAPPTPSPKAAAASADRLVSAGQAPVHASPQDKIVRRGVTSGTGGLQYVSYERTHAGLPVVGGDFVIATDAAGRVLSTSTTQTGELTVSTTPSLTPAKAAAIARKQITKPRSTTTPALTVLAEGNGRLVYETVVRGFNRPPGSYGFGPHGSYGFGPHGSYGFSPTGSYGFAPGGSYGFAGPPGSYGFAGPPGSYGFAGPPGSYGFAGPPGSYGFAGPPGSYGFSPAGSYGFAGPPGSYGFAGPPGSYGFAGPPGSYGFAGPPGSYGFAGPPGSYGLAGPPGSYGLAGPSGSYGYGPNGSYGVAAKRPTRLPERPSKLHVMVDAKTGKVVRTWDEVVNVNDDQSYYHGGRTKPTHIDTSGSNGRYTLSDSRRPGISCGTQGGTPLSGTDDAWGNADGKDLETACVDAMKAAQAEFDMLKTWLGRNGLDGNGRGWPMKVGLNQVNAWWDGTAASFGRSQSGTRQATPTDVVAHELGHGIFQTTPGGSGSSNESNGLNESTGDIFGALTEWYLNEPRVDEKFEGTVALLNYDPPDYEVGEEVDLVGSGPIRSMSDPTTASSEHPLCYGPNVPPMEPHAAAAIQNHWFYLLAEGSNANDPKNGRPNSPTCNKMTVTGVGLKKAGQIFMATLNMKTSNWTHTAVRRASLQAALNLAKAGTLTCADFTRTRDAWNAVSVPRASGEPTTCTG
ncbi:M4 family metallopeptidase [Actinomadura terrae]|uniref:M4 family metallopeptidase n=1 Tax=Actinomadura terrae TaxID=604353 RepID=UPI001FA753CD|nr:M4 family metallopeptidase [Actinomadura terrae]